MFVQMNVFSPDTVSYLYNYYFIYRVPYQNYQHMDDDLYCYQNSAGKWNVILLQHADTALYAENLPAQPVVYHDKAERPEFQGYSVSFPEDGVSLYNVYGKIILSHISTLHFNPESRLFYGKCRQGEFVAFGGYSDTMNYLLLPPNTKLEHKDRCAFIHAGTKTGYITSQSQIRIPPVYSQLTEINHTLVGEKGGKYYLFGMP